MAASTMMRQEILEIPQAVENLLSQGATAMQNTTSALVSRDPSFMISIARGSSDHAATYFKYASELLAGVPVASIGPSVASIYGRRLKLKDSACRFAKPSRRMSWAMCVRILPAIQMKPPMAITITTVTPR